MLKRQQETSDERERREALEKVRREIAIEAMRDNDDVFGLDPDDSAEPLPVTDVTKPEDWEQELEGQRGGKTVGSGPVHDEPCRTSHRCPEEAMKITLRPTFCVTENAR
jgi:hypothetical protein